MAKRQRGYKSVDDPEVLREKLTAKQELAKELRTQVYDRETELIKIKKRLKRCDTYISNMGQKLTLMKTYNSSWYQTRKSEDSPMFYVEKFMMKGPSDEWLDPEDGDQEDAVPTHGSGFMFTADQAGSKRMLVIRHPDGRLEDRAGAETFWWVWRERRKLTSLGILVPDLEFLVKHGNRNLCRLLDNVDIPENDFHNNDSYYYSVRSTKRRYLFDEKTGLWCPIVAVEEGRHIGFA